MSGWHAHAAAAHWSSDGATFTLPGNLTSIGKGALKTVKNTLANSWKGVRSVWQKTVSRVGDILIKKPVSATLHLAGWPVAKVLDGTFSGVARALTLGKVKKIQPLAKTFKTADSIVASVVDSVANIKPQWTSREWNGTRGYLKRVKMKLNAWKKTTEEARKAKKTLKMQKKASRNAAKNEAQPVRVLPKNNPLPTATKDTTHGKAPDPKETVAVAHAPAEKPALESHKEPTPAPTELDVTAHEEEKKEKHPHNDPDAAPETFD